jgi:hypothetical protein
MTAPPLLCSWDGESFVPKHPKIADRHYVVGETYPLIVHEHRSGESHRHYFASIADAWGNLPEEIAERLPTSEHLRKYALIRAGFRDERSITCASKAEAQRIAAFIKPMDDFAIVTVTEATVTIYTAKSQSLRAMGKAEFQRSKDAVLDVIAKMIGVAPAALEQNARTAA